MRHECHCGLAEHLRHFHARRMSIVGLILMSAHILFHIVECLVLPAIIFGVSEQTTRAISAEETRVERREADLGKAVVFIEQLPINTPSLVSFGETTPLR